jgi:hypothetical protein
VAPALVVAAVIALLDWGTKAAVAWTVPVGAFREVIPGVWRSGTCATRR